jgi:hypothetical protein
MFTDFMFVPSGFGELSALDLLSLAGGEVYKSIKFLFSLVPERGEGVRG